MTLLRWLGSWAYVLWISFFPPRAILDCGHVAAARRDRRPGDFVRCPDCGGWSRVLAAGRGRRVYR